jgi:hypothetical protein
VEENIAILLADLSGYTAPVSHRCNPLDPSSMNDITDATESARTILLSLNREWINKQGDFFDAAKLNEEVSHYKDIPVVSNVTQQQVMDNYYQVKMEVKRLIGEEVERLMVKKGGDT